MRECAQRQSLEHAARGWFVKGSRRPLRPNSAAPSQSIRPKVHFASGATAGLERALQAALSSGPQHAVSRRITATGGGAHRFARTVRDVLNVEMLPFQENLV